MKKSSFRLMFLGFLVLALGLPTVLFAAENSGMEAAPNLTERMMVLAIQVGVIVIAARIGCMLFEKIHLPGVLGELTMGVIIGPHLLGGIPLPHFKAFEEGLFHVNSFIQSGSTPVSPELYGFCSIASIVLLFLVGLETDLKLIARYSIAGSAVGIGGVAASFIFGDLLGVWLLPHFIPHEDSNVVYNIMHPACLFLGIMSTATSVSITARILSERNKLDTPEGVTILAGAVIDDVLGIIMLAIAIGVAGVKNVPGADSGIDWKDIGITAVKSISVWLIATLAGIALARRIGAGLKMIGGKIEISVMALGLALIVSGLFEEAKLAMIIGSYVIGLSLSRTDISHVVRESLHPLMVFMVPVFFTVMGMMVDLRSLVEPKILIFGLIYTFSAFLAKIIGCGLPSFACGFNWRGALRIGLGMVPRGEVALIVAGIGLSSGFLTKEIFGVAILMTLLTTLIPPPLLIWAFHLKGEGGKASKLPPSDGHVMKYKFPSPEMAILLLNELVTSLRKEGFFVHALDLGESLYQARKDLMVVGIKRSKQEIIFECRKEDVPIVRVAMTEVMANMEMTLSELRKPMNAQSILNLNKTDIVPTSRGGKIAKYLHPEFMVPELKATTKDEAIVELVDVLAKHESVKNRDAVLEVVMRREQAMSTGLRHGLACPHGRTDQVSQLVCAIGLKKAGIPFDSADGKPAQVVILVLSPDNTVVPYMEFMAALHVAFDVYGRSELLNCKTPDEMCEVLSKKGFTS